MPDEQQRLALLVLAGLAGVILLMSLRGQPPPPGAPPPTPGAIPPLTPEQIAAYKGDGARPAARAVPFYENEETWDLNRDAKGRLKSITVHRQASVTTP